MVEKRLLLPMRSLSAIGSDALQFLHKAVDIECGISRTFPELSSISESDVQVLVHSFRWYFVQVSKQKRTGEQITTELTSLCGLSAEEAGAVSTVALSRREELIRATVRQATQLATASLASFDWKVHLTVSSDHAATLREPIAMLQLRLARAAPHTDEDVVIELTRDDLTRLIGALSDVGGAMQKLNA